MECVQCCRVGDLCVPPDKRKPAHLSYSELGPKEQVGPGGAVCIVRLEEGMSAGSCLQGTSPKGPP